MSGLLRRTSSGEKDAKAGLGCLILFALPFAAIGLFSVYQGIQKIQAGNHKEGLVASLVGTLFTLVGFGLMGGGLYGLRGERERRKLEEAHPGEPWRWRADWAQGRADSMGRAGTLAIWIFAIFWNLVSCPVLFFFREELAKGNQGIWVGLIFLVIGVGMLLGAIYRTIQVRKFGRPVFKLLTTPCVIGGQAAGMVEVPRKVKASSGFKVRLQCVQRLSRVHDSDNQTTETVIWEDSATVTQDLLAHEPDRTGIPVQFMIPALAEETTMPSGNPSVHWRLTVSAEVTGVDLNETFELPVFRTEASPAPTGERMTESPRWDKPLEQFTPPANSRIKVENRPSGGCVVTFPAARNPGVILWVTGFAAIFGGAIYFMIVKHAPIFFPIVFGLVEGIMILSILHMLLHSSRVEADTNGLRLYDGWGFRNKESRYLASEVAEVTTRVGMRSGNTAYYDVQLNLQSGRTIGLGSSVPDREHAAWLAAVIQQAVGVKKAG